ncbi:hypothetical protein BJX62DRAFT_196014 [Aspergillus germanicus]
MTSWRMQKKSAIMARENGGRPEGFSGAAALFCRSYLGGKKNSSLQVIIIILHQTSHWT